MGYVDEASIVSCLQAYTISYKSGGKMNRIYNPAHPGLVLREYLGDVTVTAAAEHLSVTRAAVSRILNGSAGIPPIWRYDWKPY